MAATRTSVRLVSGAREVTDLIRSLPAEMRTSAFHHPAWIEAWYAVEDRAARETVAAIVEDATQRPLMVLPLVLDTFGSSHFWAPLDLGVTDYNTSMIAPDFHPNPLEMQAVWTRIVAALPDHAGFLLLDKVPQGLGDHHEPLAALPRVRHSHVVRHPLHLDADWEKLRATRFDQSMVRSLTRKRRKLERKGDLVFSVMTGEAALPALDALMTWRGERFGDRPAITDLYARVVASGDPARVLCLTLDGRPISAGLGLLEKDAFRLLAIAHDDSWKNWSPGLLVVEDAIRWAVETGLYEFDFTIGSEPYKFDFGVEPEPMWLVAEEFGPHGSAMLRVILTRNYLASRLKRWVHTGTPRRRDAHASVG